MYLKEKYENIITKMEKINYKNIWPNFHQYNIALYDDNYVCYQGRLFPKTKDFIANTSIKYNDEMIGIWYLQEDLDDDILTSKLIHETFHAFQFENKETRYPNEIEALLNYKYDLKNLSLKFFENKLIVSLIESFNKDLFNELINIRKTRLKLFPYEVQYEMAIEQIEGTANYVELESLKQLNYSKFIKKLNNMKNQILNPNNLFPVRIISYDIGALFIKILIDNGLKIDYDFNNNFYLNYYLNSCDLVQIDIEESPEVQKSMEEFFIETKTIIEKSVKQENLIIKGNYKLLGVNIYNARCLYNYIISEYFLMYKDNNDEKILNGDFVIKLDNQFNILEVYKLDR